MESEDIYCDRIMRALKKHYKREKSLCVRAPNLVHVKQSQGEDSRDFSKRAESLSRDLEFFNSANGDKHELSQKARTELAFVLAVNGSKDQNMRKNEFESDDLI